MSDNVIKFYDGDLRYHTLFEALMEVLYERSQGMPGAGIIGTIELVKMDVKRQLEEQVDD